MQAGDLVKPKGYQFIVNRSKLKGVQKGVILRVVRRHAGGMLIKRYVVLWSNKNIVEHAWLEIELLEGVENGI